MFRREVFWVILATVFGWLWPVKWATSPLGEFVGDVIWNGKPAKRYCRQVREQHTAESSPYIILDSESFRPRRIYGEVIVNHNYVVQDDKIVSLPTTLGPPTQHSIVCDV
jgi:hypothetical protein